MDSSEAHKYIIDPLIAPDPSDETGLNCSFRSTFAPAPTNMSSSQGSTPPMAHPPHPPHPTPINSPHSRVNRSRCNALSQLFPADKSHQPLAMVKADAKAAHRSPHLKRRSIPAVDTI